MYGDNIKEAMQKAVVWMFPAKDYMVNKYLERLSYLIIKFFAPDACSTFAGSSWVATLNHKTLDISVKYGAVIITAGTQCQKVLQANIFFFLTEQMYNLRQRN